MEAQQTVSLVERLAEQLGSHSGTQMVYGAPVARDGITVVPVARIRYGFGGGVGGERQQGSGGGGGVYAAPVGFIELREGRVRFRGITPRGWTLVRVLLGASLGAWLVLRGLGALASASHRAQSGGAGRRFRVRR